MNAIDTARRVQRVRHELVRRELTVTRITPVTPHLLALTFGGESLDGFRSDSFDDHIKLIFTAADGREVRRDYTPRHYDAVRRELTVEFALHDGGHASDWARAARIGTPALIGGPRGSMIIPMDYDWHVLAGDATAFPAIARRLEELPVGTRVTVVAQAPDPADHRVWQSRAALESIWVHSDDAFVQALQQMVLPAGEGFVWCAGEASAMARVRQVFIEQHRHPREALRVAAYWKRGEADFHDRLEG